MSFVCGMVSGTFLDVDHPKTGCRGKHVTGLRLQRNGYRAFPVDKLLDSLSLNKGSQGLFQLTQNEDMVLTG